ncbi:MAG: chemotaxis response regulator protein-glutamate methylesterase [Deltaproteobacteria bacterium]|nr:chemotaxis response regulator protein-glutamate methylesterase [Deltaproteobacteria bacterium]
MRKKLKVLIVDDSALVRQILCEVFAKDPGLEVVGMAADPYAAWQKIKAVHPDVLTLDVEMPRMDGVAFLEKLMCAHPMPVVMISSLTEKGCETTLRALELGAIDFVTKPKIDIRNGTIEMADEIIAKVKVAGRALPRRREPFKIEQQKPAKILRSDALVKSTHKVIAVGASTGGTEALRELLTTLPADCPGLIVVQHMPEKFTCSFAERLDSLCQIRVKEARDGDRILPGHALIAPGNYHMIVTRSGAEYSVRVFMAEPVNRHRPSVDVLFESCARYLGSNAVGVILTGMGNDGARGLLAMHQAGARTIAQDEASCVVFGMPKEAIALGGVDEVVGLDHIAAAVTRQLILN